ncbi:MAG: thiamine pyrophosphate-binding protein [Candidatus Xenobia bacterium]
MSLTDSLPGSSAAADEPARVRLTGAEIVAEALIAGGVPYVFGIPGHGDVCLFDALIDRKSRIQAQIVMHEQSAAHMADAYYRVSGQPCAVFTSIGPGACNTTIGVGQAYVDSTAMMVITGSAHTYMRGKSVLQEIDRQQFANFAEVLSPLVKQAFRPTRVDTLPFTMQRAFSEMLSGRPGPVLVDVPMDVQAEAAEVDMCLLRDLAARRARGGPRPDAEEVEKAATLLADATRPVILCGGGCITSTAAKEVQELAELLGAAVVTTWNGKGTLAEDHPLYGYHPGHPGTSIGNTLCRTADVLLAVGCRFTDWSASSYRRDTSFSIPPTKLIHVDIDAREVGKNFPATVGLVADARRALTDLLAALKPRVKARDWKNAAYTGEIARLRQEWLALLAPHQQAGHPPTISRALVEIRKALPRDGIVVTGAGLVQNQTYQEFPVYGPRQHITSGGFSTMGFTLPGAIGAKLAAGPRPVLGLAGDGDFLQTVQELGVAAQLDLPVVIVVLNNCGFSSIRNLQEGQFGKDRSIVTEFKRKGQDYTPHLANVASAFGIRGERVEDASRIAPAVEAALASEEPSLVEVLVDKRGLTGTGWWDIPVPEYLKPSFDRWQEGRRGEALY